ncbi:hypothetical protein HDV02_002975 [Globomyces sp. JEL0801]|nr:hypothetical protein HDV02_002975 [Globomyces sp. JEL0801]
MNKIGMTNSLDLINYRNNIYLIDAWIGQQQKFSLVLDTGSSDTWVRGPKCKPHELENNGSNNQKFDNSCEGAKLNTSDSSIKDLGKQVMIKYLDESTTKLDIYKVPFAIGTSKSVIPIGVSTEQVGFPIGDGILGLGLDNQSIITKQSGISSNVFDSFNFTTYENIFGIYFSQEEDNICGCITLGGIEPSKFIGPITYFPIQNATHWQFKINQFKMMIQSMKFNFNTTTIVLDSGTTNIILNDIMAKSINEKLGAVLLQNHSTIYQIDCSKLNSLPIISFLINGIQIQFDSRIYIQKMLLDNKSLVCTSRFHGGGGDWMIFGMVFHRQFYTIYDKFNRRVGFARAIHAGKSVVNDSVLLDWNDGNENNALTMPYFYASLAWGLIFAFNL